LVGRQPIKIIFTGYGRQPIKIIFTGYDLRTKSRRNFRKTKQKKSTNAKDLINF
jgi:hypothetical protein